MFDNFNEKGKLFTDVVSKKGISIIMQTTAHKIRGVIHARLGERLKDELNNPERFIAITNAEILDTNNQIIHSSNFLAINSDNIVWLFPDNKEA
jgi:hypothetical protein